MPLLINGLITQKTPQKWGEDVLCLISFLLVLNLFFLNFSLHISVSPLFLFFHLFLCFHIGFPFCIISDSTISSTALSIYTLLISFILYSLFYFISFLLSSYLHVSSKIFASSLFIFNAASKHAPTFKPWGLSVPAYRTGLSSDCYIFYACNALFQLWN